MRIAAPCSGRGFLSLLQSIIAAIVVALTALLGAFYVQQNNAPQTPPPSTTSSPSTPSAPTPPPSTPPAPTAPGTVGTSTAPAATTPSTTVSVGAVSQTTSTTTAEEAPVTPAAPTTGAAGALGQPTAPGAVSGGTAQQQADAQAGGDTATQTETQSAAASGALTPGAKSDGTDGFVADAGGASTLHGEIWDYCGRKDDAWMAQKWNKACARNVVTAVFKNVAKKATPGTLTLTICGDHDDPCKHGDFGSGHDDCGRDFSGGEVMQVAIDDIDLGYIFSTFTDDDRFGGLTGGPGPDRGTIQQSVLTGTAHLTADEIARITADGEITLTFSMPFGGMVDIYPDYGANGLQHQMCSLQEYIKMDLQY